MKAITIKQPWASLIVDGIKDVENRTWNTNFRGRVLIHSASKSWIWNKVINYLTEERIVIFEKFGFNGSWLRNLPTGKIIGSVEIVNCIAKKMTGNDSKSIWADKGAYHWILRSPIKFDDPIEAKGKLSFWDYEFDEGTFECTNTNPYAHQSCGERQGCIQNCNECDYWKYKYDIL